MEAIATFKVDAVWRCCAAMCAVGTFLAFSAVNTEWAVHGTIGIRGALNTNAVWVAGLLIFAIRVSDTFDAITTRNIAGVLVLAIRIGCAWGNAFVTRIANGCRARTVGVR